MWEEGHVETLTANIFNPELDHYIQHFNIDSNIDPKLPWEELGQQWLLLFATTWTITDDMNLGHCLHGCHFQEDGVALSNLVC